MDMQNEFRFGMIGPEKLAYEWFYVPFHGSIMLFGEGWLGD
jgi:hypothetical protein